MHRIDTPTAQIDKFGPGKNGFTNGDPATGRRATDLNSDMWDAVQEEMANAIEGNGIALDKSKHNQLYLAIQKAITDPGFLKKANNLSDLANVAEARGNLQLGTAATKNVGTATGNVMQVGAFGLGMGPIHRDDAWSNIAQIYRVSVNSANRPSNITSGVICIPCDGSPAAGYIAAALNGDAYVGYSKAAAGGVAWNRVYTTGYKPTAADVNAYTKQESDGRYIHKTGDTISWLTVQDGLSTGNDLTAGRTLYVNGQDFIMKRGLQDPVNNERQTNGMRIQGAGNLFVDLYQHERIGQHHFFGIHVANGGADGWYEFRNDGAFSAGSTVAAGGNYGGKLYPDGNISGTIWGGYLRDWLNNNTYGPQRPQPPVQVNTDAIGSLAFARLNPQNSRVGYGELVSGSNLSPSGVTGYPGGGNWSALFAEGQLGGTWKCLGLCISDSEGGNRHYGVSLFVRVS